MKTFNHEIFGAIRTVEMPDGQAGFVAVDITEVLGYKNSSKAINDHVDDDDKTTLTICSSGSNYKTKVIAITESGLYSLILASKLPQAREFKRWVTSVVLPQIRMTGGYIPMEEGDDANALLRKAVMMLQQTVELKDEIIESQRLKVAFANAVSADTTLCTLAELAKLICNAGVPIGQNRLCEWMREHGYLGRSRHHWNTPHQQWIDQGLFVIKIYKTPFVSRGYTYEVMPMVTAKGQEYFVEKFLGLQMAA